MDEVFGKVPASDRVSSVIEHAICPRPGFPGQYYFIYKTHYASNTLDDIRYVLINGYSKTVSSPITLIAGQKTGEGFTVSKYDCQNNRYWLFTTRLENSTGFVTLRRTEITAAGLFGTVDVYTINLTNNSSGAVITALEISSVGNTLAVCLFSNSSDKAVSIFDFDINTGVISSERFYTSSSGYGIVTCEFSPDGSRLYLMQGGSSSFPNEVFSCPVIASGSYVFTTADLLSSISINGSLAMELAYDGKIYINKGHNSASYYCITNPNNIVPTIVSTASPFLGTTLYRLGDSFPDQIDGFDTGGSVSPSISATSTILCSGASATLTASGGINYQWTTSSADTNSVLIVSPSVTTTYYVNVMSGSCSVIDSITIVVDTILNVIVSGVLDVCVGQSTTLAAIGATSYLWSGGASGTTPSIIVMPLTTTQYYLTSTSSCGTAIDTITVNVNPLPSVAASPNQTICLGQTATLTATGIGSYLWTGGILDTTASVIVTPLVTTNYFITTSNSCGNAVDSVLVSVIAAASVAFDYTFNTCTSAYSFNNNSVNSFSNLWYFGDSTQSNLASPVHVYGNGTYLVWLIINAGTDCADSISQNITVNNNNQLTPFIPNVFTPNNDGINDEFVINDISDCAQYHLTIYDRWGIKVFETKQLSVFWDGRKGKQNEIVEGIYFYILEISNTSSSTSFINGSVSITR